MQILLSNKFLQGVAAFLLILAVSVPGTALAEVEGIAVTLDNDMFVGEDNGYTNGIYLSWWDGPEGKQVAEPGLLARAMLWSLPKSDAPGVAIKTVGQVMVTPEDIEEDPPILPPDDLPYAGLLFYADTWVQVHDSFADKVSVRIGIVGEYSFAQEAQETVHEIIGADEPCCWDTQLDDEIVFQFGRGRIWESWVSDSGHTDLLLGVDLELGTITSSAGVSMMIRYGRDLEQTFASVLLVNSRTTNPVASETGWYVFAGARAGYLANQIFLDGSKSYDDDYDEIDYDEEILAVTTGLAYSWNDLSLTFALNNLNVNENDDGAEKYSEYGTITVALKLD